MKVLGHSQIGLTMNTYAHVLPEIERAAVDEAAKPLRMTWLYEWLYGGCTGHLASRPKWARRSATSDVICSPASTVMKTRASHPSGE